MLDLKELIAKVLTRMVVTTWTPSITASTGTLVSAEGHTVCGIHTLKISVRKSTATANGANVFYGTLNNHRPKQQVCGFGYNSGLGFGFNLGADGNITVRNVGNGTLTANNAVIVTVTYVGGVVRKLLKALQSLAFRGEVIAC